MTSREPATPLRRDRLRVAMRLSPPRPVAGLLSGVFLMSTNPESLEARVRELESRYVKVVSALNDMFDAVSVNRNRIKALESQFVRMRNDLTGQIVINDARFARLEGLVK